MCSLKGTKNRDEAAQYEPVPVIRPASVPSVLFPVTVGVEVCWCLGCCHAAVIQSLHILLF